MSDESDAPPDPVLSCFGDDGTPLRIGLPPSGLGLSTMTATRIEQPTDADFVPPGPVTD